VNSGTNADKRTFTHGWTPKPSPHDSCCVRLEALRKAGLCFFLGPGSFFGGPFCCGGFEPDDSSEQF
jgi:hypothetical protein